MLIQTQLPLIQIVLAPPPFNLNQKYNYILHLTTALQFWL